MAPPPRGIRRRQERPMNGLILFAALSLGSIERGEAAFCPTADEAGVPARVRRAPADGVGVPAGSRRGPAVSACELEPLRDERSYSVAAVRFPSPVVSPEP